MSVLIMHNTDYFCRKTKITDDALEKKVDYQFEFPRQYII